MFNRTKRVRHPLTGKVAVKMRPENEIVQVDMPDLRIVDDDLAAKVTAHFRP